jgi:uncharacterized coiled-coil protein SlyX
MKIKIIRASIIVCLLFINNHLTAQSTSNNNNTGANKYLGYNGAQNLEFRTNNITRMQLMETGNSTINGNVINRSGFLGLSQDPTFFSSGIASPFSLLHLNGDNIGQGPQTSGYRSWMRYGLTFTHNRDLMYIGMKRVGLNDVTDAVIGWADNGVGPVGPDNLTFNFLGGDGSGSGSLSDGGLELARMTSEGRTGIGTSWNNTFQPQRTLDVIFQSNDAPQFRLTRGRDADVDLGQHADYQVDDLGRLFIRPWDGGRFRPTAIGFLRSDVTGASPALVGGLPDPDTRLDVGGLTRVRDLPDRAPNTLLIGFSEGANVAIDEDQFLGRLDFPAGENPECFVLAGNGTWVDICNLGGADLDWETDGTDVWTAHGTGGYPDRNVYIGSPSFFPAGDGKLNVFTNLSTYFQTSARTGGVFEVDATSAPITPPFANGLRIEVRGAYAYNRGSLTILDDVDPFINIGAQYDIFSSPAGYNVGVTSFITAGITNLSNGFNTGYQARVDNSGAPGDVLNNYGLDAFVCNAQNNYGVYAETCTNTANDWAGYFVGDVFSQGGYSTSDLSLKENIEEIQSPSELLNSIDVRSYNFIQDAPMPMSEERHFGVIANQLETVLPELVRETVLPLRTDTAGNVIREEFTFKSVRYNDLIAILIAGFQEQNGIMEGQAEIIETQNETIAAMEDALAEQQSQLEELQNNMAQLASQFQSVQQKTTSCCDKVNAPATGFQNNSYGPEMKLEQNVPNPFDQYTRIGFDIPRDAQVILEISDASGRPIETLIDGQMSAGKHSFEWDGSRVAPGIYFYTLYANGELITKKMIKK